MTKSWFGLFSQKHRVTSFPLCKSQFSVDESDNTQHDITLVQNGGHLLSRGLWWQKNIPWHERFYVLDQQSVTLETLFLSKRQFFSYYTNIGFSISTGSEVALVPMLALGWRLCWLRVVTLSGTDLLFHRCESLWRVNSLHHCIHLFSKET